MTIFKYKNILPFWLFTGSVIIVLIVSQLIQEGMFMDGLFYTCVGKNLADGLGTFWNPHLSKSFIYSFHAQPPLYFGILALFYKVFGNSMYVERLFDFTFFLGAAFYIHKLWNKIFSSNKIVAVNSWLPVLFWSTIPICFWAYSNNVEEVVMSFFVIAAVYHIFIALHLHEKIIFNLIIAGVFLFLASLTKGAQGLFPIAAVAFYWFLFRQLSFKQTIYYTSILIIVPALIYAVLLITNSEVYTSFHNYFNIRYMRAFNNLDSTTDNRFDILIQLFMELLPIILFSILIFVLTRKNRKKQKQEQTNSKIIYWLILIGLSGSIPLIITLEQRNFYLVTALPYFAIAIAMTVALPISTFIGRINSGKIGIKIITLITFLLLISSIIFTVTRIGKAKRDEDALTDINNFGKIIPHGEIVGIPPEMISDWSIRYYLLRYYYISLDDQNKSCNYFISEKNIPERSVPANYKPYPIETKLLKLYTCGK